MITCLAVDAVREVHMIMEVIRLGGEAERLGGMLGRLL
jgi:hypothetical protein